MWRQPVKVIKAMRKKKEPVVILVVPKANIERAFGIEHAERLLDMGSFKNGGWELPENSNYQYDEENGLRLKTDKGNSAKAI